MNPSFELSITKVDTRDARGSFSAAMDISGGYSGGFK
jgi:hypothetical protein